MKKAELEAAGKHYVKNWETGERDEMEARLANGFTFTSPQDDRLDGAAFLERCWPQAGKAALSLQRVAAIGPKDCIVVYEGKDEKSAFRRVELLRFDKDRLLSAEVFVGRPPGEAPAPPETAIRELLDAQQQAIRDRDIERATAAYAEDVVCFDVVTALRNSGKPAMRDRLERWLESYEGAIESELRDLQVVASADVAFASALQRFAGTMNGRADQRWLRVTWGLRRADGGWRIVHQHASQPYDLESGMARLDLTP